MTHAKTIGFAAILFVFAIIGGDIWLAYFGSQALTIIAGEYGLGPSPIEFFTLMFIADLVFSTTIINQWVTVVENLRGYSYPLAASQALLRRGAALLGVKLAAGPLSIAIAYGIHHFLPAW